MKIEKITIKEVKKYAFIVLAVTVYVLSCLKYSINHNIKIFNREIGLASAIDFDIDVVLRRLYFSYFFALPVLIIFLVILVGIYNKKCLCPRNSEGLLIDMNKYAFFFLISLLCEFVTKFDTTENFASICNLEFVVLLCMLVYPMLRKREMIDTCDLKWIIIVDFNIALFVSFFGLNYIIAFGVLFIFTCLFMNAMNNERVKQIGSPLSMYIGISAVILELIVVLNQYGLFVKHLKILFGVIFLIVLLIGLVQIKSPQKNNSYTNIMNIGILLGMVGMTALPKIQTVVSTDLFEQANSAVSVNQLVEFGKMPFVETISAHLASDWLPGLVYYFFNRDINGAFFSPYTSLFNTVWILVLYYILKEIMSSEDALLLCLFVPFFSFSSGWQGIGLISVAALVHLVKEGASFARAIFFWCILLISLLYKADVGLALGLAAIVTYIAIKILYKEKIDWKDYILSGGFVAVIAGSIFFVLCYVKGINVIQRIKEFIEIFATSNEIWSYGEFGTAGTMQYTIIYFFVPVLIIITLLAYGLKIWKGRTNNKILDAVILNMGIAYFFNLQRIIVRHNLREGGYSVSLTFTAGVFFALVLMEAIRHEREKVFTCVYLALGCFFSFETLRTLSVSDVEIASKYNLSLASMGFEKIYDNTFVEDYTFTEKIERVQIDQQMQNQYEYVVGEIQELLKDDETFFDFSNQSLIYALAHKKLPVYVVQSPGQISGDFGQSMFINEIKRENCPIAISVGSGDLNCGIGVDGIQHSYRQYRISEYLNNNYNPLETVGDFVVWVRNDRADIAQKVQQKFRPFEIKGLCNDCILKKKDNQISVISTGNDPFVGDIEIPQMQDECFSISMRYKSNMTGQMQVFYTDDLGKGYSEDRSIIMNIENEGIVHVTLDSAQAKYMRIDIPSGAQVELERIWISDGDYALCDYSYGNYSQIHAYALGAIPYLWGNLDTKNANRNDKILQCVEKQGKYDIIPDIIKYDNAVYLQVIIDSPEDVITDISLGRCSGEQYTERIKYNLKVYAGEHKYLIRVSADSNWIRGDINSIYIGTQSDIVKSVSFIKGD